MSRGSDPRSEEGLWLRGLEGAALHDEVLLCIAELLALGDDVLEGIATKASTEVNLDRVLLPWDGRLSTSRLHREGKLLRLHLGANVCVRELRSTSLVTGKACDVLLHVDAVVELRRRSGLSRLPELSRHEHAGADSSTR